MSVRGRVVTHTERSSRTRILASSCIAAWLALSGCAPAEFDARTESESELAVDGTTPAIVRRQLQAGSYLVEVRERGIDLRLLVDAPGVHAESTDFVPRHGVLHEVVSLREPAELSVTLRSADHRTRKGAALLRLARWNRAVDGAPTDLEKGYRALAAAGELTARKTPTDSQMAVDRIHEAISHFEAAGATAARAQAQYTLANLLNERSDYAGTLRAAREAADDFDTLDDETGLQNAATIRAAAELELALGMDSSRQGAEQKAMYDSADRLLQSSVEYFSKQGLPARAAYATNMRGIHAAYIGNLEVAAKFFVRVVELTKADQDAREQAIALANLAWIHNRLGFFTQAAAEYGALLPMIEKDKEPYQYAVAIANYGFCLIMLGDFDRALALHNEALSMYVAQGKEAERATELSALGSLYFRIGDARRALDILLMAIAAHKRLGNAGAQAAALRVAGNAASALGDHQAALAYLRKSSQIDTTPYPVARTSVLVAGELRELGDFRGANAELALALDSRIPLVRAAALVERARLTLAQHRPREAISDLRAADREYVAIGLDFDRIETNTELSRALLATGDLAGASAAADEAVAIAGRIRAKSANPEWRARFVSSRYSPYEARIAADLAGGGTAAAWKAFHTAEEVRARSLADQLAVGPSSAPSVAKAENLRAKLTSLQLSLEARAQKLDLDAPELVDLRRNVAETRARLDASRASVAARETTLPASLEEVQAALPADTAVLEYFVGDRESHVWLLTHKALRHLRLPGLDRLQKEVTAALGSRGAAAGIGQLGRLLLGTVLEGIDARRMLIIPDGPLNAVPFAALPVGHDRSQMLVDRFVIAYAPSLSLAMKGARRAAQRHSRVAVVSDPVYAPDDRRLQLALGMNGGPLRGPVEASPNNLTRLPYSGLEARAVLDALGREQAITLEGFDATPARVYSLPFNDLGVLHFATHASARQDSAEQSALYLSEYAADGSRITDSRITVGQIAQSGLRADLVVLSGCATGDGSELRGEGVLGLTYGFLANGSGAVVASLWPIEDASTARFMKEFYGAYRANAQPAEALRVAQLHSRGVTASAVWASFVVRANGFP